MSAQPCPFCGKDDVGVYQPPHMAQDNYEATCFHCEARGPIRDSYQEALKGWDTRAPSATYLELRKAARDLLRCYREGELSTGLSYREGLAALGKALELPEDWQLTDLNPQETTK